MVNSRAVDLRVPFVGRASEFRRLLTFLKRGGFVTLVGPGGVGKSRLAYEAVSQFERETARQAAFVMLAGVAAEAVLGTVMQTLEISEEPGRPPVDTLRDALSETPVILVLDNCEHAPDETSALMDALRMVEGLTIVATSQRRLDYAEEEVFELEPLTLEEAVAFFYERAQIEQDDVTDDIADTVASIVRTLDGLPVAVDLAAARLASLSLRELAAELKSLRPYHLRSTRGSDPRHRTIGNVIAWSFSRLSEDAKRAFAIASLFSDEFDVQDVAFVAKIDAIDASFALDEAAETSLVMRTEFGYRMLSPIRAVATRSLAAMANRRGYEERFALRMDAVAAALWEDIRSANAGAAMYRLFLRYNDFCNAIGWAMKRPAERFPSIPSIMTTMIAAWAEGGRFTEGLTWAERLESIAERLKPNLRGRIYYLGLCIAHAAGEYQRMLERAPATISAFTISGDRLGLARAYNALAAAAFNTGVLEDAWKYAETALQVYNQMGHQRGVGAAMINQGNVLFEGRDDIAGARVIFRNALDVLEKDGTDVLLGIALGNLADVEYAAMEYDKSNEYSVAAISRFEAAASLAHIAWIHETQARVAIARSLAPAAKEHLHLACDLLRRTPQPQFIARLGEVLARLLIFVGQEEEAALALAASTRLRDSRSLVRMGFVATEVTDDEILLREELGESALAGIAHRVAGWDLGHLTSFFQALLVGIGRSETWRRPDIVGEPNARH